MSDELEQIVVLREHLEEWQEALAWAHTHHSAIDLANNARQTRRSYTPTNLTRRLGRSVERIQGYLGVEESAE